MIPNRETDDLWLLIHEAVVLDEWFLVFVKERGTFI